MKFKTAYSMGFLKANEESNARITIPVANEKEAEKLAKKIRRQFDVEYLLEKDVQPKQQPKQEPMKEIYLNVNVDCKELDETQEKADQLKTTLEEVTRLIGSLSTKKYTYQNAKRDTKG